MQRTAIPKHRPDRIQPRLSLPELRARLAAPAWRRPLEQLADDLAKPDNPAPAPAGSDQDVTHRPGAN